MAIAIAWVILLLTGVQAEEVGARWGTEQREREYYRVVSVPIPKGQVIESGAFELMPDNRMAIGTRRGDIYFMSGVDDDKPRPRFEKFAEGLDEIFGLAHRKGEEDTLYVTHSAELTRARDTNGDGRADRFETVSDAWGYRNYHEYAFGSKFDAQGNLYVALGLSASYHSRALFRGWAMKITPDGKSIPIASGLRSPGGIGPNEYGALFYIESQGPWNSSCSLKFLKHGGFMGHPVSQLVPVRARSKASGGAGKRHADCLREGKGEGACAVCRGVSLHPHGPLDHRLRGRQNGWQVWAVRKPNFLGDYTQSIIMRATTEQINGVWQGACYPFREGLSTGILNVQFTPKGRLLAGGTNRGWPVRGTKPFALERLDWTGKLPFEIKRIHIAPDGFKILFTKPVDAKTGNDPKSYKVTTFTHNYHRGYGGPEVDQTTPTVQRAELAADGLSARITLSELKRGHVYEFDLESLRDRSAGSLHRHAYYTVNERRNNFEIG